MYNENLMIVGYDFGYNYNSYYVDRKNKNTSWPSELEIARSINLSVTDNDLGSYEVSNVTVKTNTVVDNKVVTQYHNLKLVKIYTNYKCTRTSTSGSSVTTYVRSKVFYPMCNKVNVLCSGRSGAYVPSVTVCSQGL